MERTLKDIKRALPDLKSEKVVVLADELDRILTVKKIFSSADGKVLIDVLRDNCVVALRKLVIKAKDNPDLPSLLGLIATYSSNIDLLSQLQDISIEQEIKEQLDQAVKEAYE